MSDSPIRTPPGKLLCGQQFAPREDIVIQGEGTGQDPLVKDMITGDPWVDDDTGIRRPSHASLVTGGGHVAAQETGSFEVGRPQAVNEGTDPQVPERQFSRAFREGRTGARWSNPDLAFEPVHDQGSKSGTMAWNEDLRVRVLDSHF